MNVTQHPHFRATVRKQSYKLIRWGVFPINSLGGDLKALWTISIKAD